MIKVVKTKFVWNCAVCSSLFLLHFYSRSSNNFMWTTYIRVGKTGTLGSWGRVIVYCSSFPFAEMIVPFGGSFWQKDSLLQCTITLLHCPKELSFCRNDCPIWGVILAKGQFATMHNHSAPRPQRSCFANPNLHKQPVWMSARSKWVFASEYQI